MALARLFDGPYLGDFRGRDNNFNLIRFLAASSVIWTHAFGLLNRTGLEPVFRIFGIGAGDVAVDIFFVLSGFLVSKSWAGKNLLQFAWARFIRIYPGLWFSIFISVLIVSMFFSDETPFGFLSSHSTVTYLLHNAAMLPAIGARLDLPHAFHYVDTDFNVPLWTLPYEIKMYGLLALIGLAVGLRAPYTIALLALGLIGVGLDSLLSFHLLTIDLWRFIFFFFSGASAYALRDKIPLRSWLTACLVLALAATVLMTHSYSFRQPVLLIALPYLVLWAAFIPQGYIHQWNRFGDYSYGMYIYGCPVQLALISTNTTKTVGANFLLSLSITLALAVFSWHFVERIALQKPLPRLLTLNFKRPAPRSAE